MLRISFISKNREKILFRLKKRNFKKIYLIDEVLLLDKKRKKIQNILNKILEKENILSKKIGKLLIKNKNYELNDIKNKCILSKNKKKKLKKELKDILFIINQKLINIPNIPDKYVNKNFDKNNILFKEKKIKKLVNNPLPHWELTKKFNLFDLSLGSKMCGTGFSVYIDKCAKLQRSLIQYFLDINIKYSYKEYNLPYLINEMSGISTGQIPDKENQMYFIENDKLYLIPTGEVPLMNCYRDKIFNENDLPIKATTYTPCFRREAGSYGTKSKGINRLHQFDKVEIIQITSSKNSNYALKNMILHVKNIIISLNLPFRILRLTGPDLGYSSSITYDIEVYSIAQKKWLEVSSISNCTNFQSNRLNIKYKNNVTGEIALCHTLNGSSLAIPRILVTLLENYQTNYQINIPKVLIPYTGFDSIK